VAKPSGSGIPRNDPDFRRYEVYRRCVNSIKAWLDIFFSTPLLMLGSLPFGTYSQLCYVVFFLHQLTARTDDAAWSPAATGEVVDLFQTIDRIIQTLEQLKAAAAAAINTGSTSGSGEDQALSLGLKKFRALKSAWNSELAYGAEPLDGFRPLFSTISTDPFYSSDFHMLPNMSDGSPFID
jgi:hypothetical protein